MNSKTLKLILLALLALVTGLVAQSGFAEALDLKTGAWESTTTTTIKGSLIPKATLEQLAPDARAKVEQQIRERTAKPHVQTIRSCVTQDKLDRSDLLQSTNPDCTRKILSHSAHKLEVEESCPAPHASKSHYVLLSSSPERYESTIDISQQDGKIHVDMAGHWVSTECSENEEK